MSLQLRKLDVLEHHRTRFLWEEVFSEDTKQFLDYYYFLKTRENEIYVLENDDEIKSMIHLNPYQVKMGESQHLLHYIVAVATKAECRKQGYMRTLLCRCMEEMYQRKEPFTFLMPAAEAIYAPYDFRFVYWQNQVQLPVEELHLPVCEREAGLGDASCMAEFYQNFCAPQDQVCIWKDEAYFQNKLFEQKSENGGIRLIEQNKEIVCMYAYDNEDGLEVSEPYVLQGAEGEFQQSMYHLAGDNECTVPIFGFHMNEITFRERMQGLCQKPLIMARIIHLKTFLEQLRTVEGEQICCSFAVLDIYLQKNSGIWNLRSDPERAGHIIVSEAEDSEGVFPIAVLTKLLFGVISVEQLENEADVIIGEHLKEELQKIEVWKPVFINEVV